MIFLPRPHPSLLFAALLLVFATCAGNLRAQPAAARQGIPGAAAPTLETDFFGLTETVVAGEPFGFELRAFSPGPERPNGWVSFQIPNGLLLAARPACGDWSYEPLTRQWRVDGPWEPGRIYSCRVELLAPDDKGSLFLTLEKSTFRPDRYDRVEREIPMRELPAASRVLFRIGQIGIGWVEIGVLFFFLCIALLVLAGRPGRSERNQPSKGWLRKNFGYLAMIGVCLFFLAIFAAMAADDWRAREFTETSCEVLDAERQVNESRKEDRHKVTYSFDARVAVAYERGGLRTVTLATRPDSFLDLSESRAAALLASLEQGATIPCWVDPRDHRTVLFERGFGGAYVFALIPLGLIAVMVWSMRRPGWWRRRP